MNWEPWIEKLPALSIRQPWAWLILNAGKDIENRTRRSHYRGWFLVHASLGCTPQEYQEAYAFATVRCGVPAGSIPPLDDMKRGGVVGMAKLGGCTTASESKWFVGPFGYMLDDFRLLPFRPCKGALGFFKPKF